MLIVREIVYYYNLMSDLDKEYLRSDEEIVKNI